MDGTLYEFDSENGGYGGSGIEKMVNENAINYICSITGNSYDESRGEVQRCVDTKESLSEHVSSSYDVSIEDYFDTVWDLDPKGLVVVDARIPELISKLDNKNIPIVLITHAPDVWRRRIFEHFRLNDDSFHGIYTREKARNKGEIMLSLIEELKSSRGFSIGDQYETDIRSAEELGLQTFHVTSLQDTISALEKILEDN